MPMKSETVASFVKGLTRAGIDFVVTLPFTQGAPLLPAIAREPRFKHVPVGNEGDGIVICAGAWMGGKRPALLIENTALVLGAYALTGLDGMYGGMPMLLLVDHRGSYGDGGGYWYFGGGLMAPIILDGLRIPYTKIAEPSGLEETIVRGQSTAEAYGKPVALLMECTDYW
jgi:sulfopyruvate decarboxylase subunit alpha